MNVLSIDPGALTGWAVGNTETKKLIQTDLLVGYNGDLMTGLNILQKIYDPWVLWMEFPQIYDRKNWKGDPNDLLKVAYCAGKCAGHFENLNRSVRIWFPNQWKGQRSKPADHKYTKRLLDPNEMKIIKELEKKYPISKSHNALDAVGILLKALGRR